jgi:hypothetical protein
MVKFKMVSVLELFTLSFKLRGKTVDKDWA